MQLFNQEILKLHLCWLDSNPWSCAPRSDPLSTMPNFLMKFFSNFPRFYNISVAESLVGSNNNRRFCRISHEKVVHLKSDLHYSIDIIQEESSLRFTLSFHTHCVKMQKFNQNLIDPLARQHPAIFPFFVWTLEPWNVFEVAWQISSWLMSIQFIYFKLLHNSSLNKNLY